MITQLLRLVQYLWTNYEILLFLIGLGILILVIRRVIKRIFTTNHGVSTEGWVIKIEKVETDIDTSYYPVIEYETLKGEKYTITGNSVNNQHLLFKGQKFNIKYHPKSPEIALLDKPYKIHDDKGVILSLIIATILISISFLI